MTRHPPDERGNVIVLMAIGMVVLTLMVALVVDHASTRASRTKARAAADAAATAGVMDLVGTGATNACATAFVYAFFNLGVDQPSDIQGRCSSATNGGMGAVCTSGGPARVATFTVDDTTVQVTNPVPDDDRLLRATAVGGGADQPAHSGVQVTDGVQCQRLGVEITRPQSLIFGGVATSSNGRFSVHSVARYQPTLRESNILPALILLDRSACSAVDITGTGRIDVAATATGPGVIFSDSDARCPRGEAIFNIRSNGSLRAAAQSRTVPGELAWVARPDGSEAGFLPGPPDDQNGPTHSENSLVDGPADYVGKRYGRETPTGRTALDARYNCGVLPANPLAPCTTDPVAAARALAEGSGAPAGWPTRSACSSGAAFPPILVDTFVNCPAGQPFEVKGGPLVVKKGVTVVFQNALKVNGGTLAVNVTSPTAPAVGATGLPEPDVAAHQSRVIVRSTDERAVDLTGGDVYMAQTFLYSRGGFNMQAGIKLRWSPPSAGPTKSLLYWSESPEDFNLQGGPTLEAAGVVLHAHPERGQVKLSGTADIDLSDVQLWAKKLTLSGVPTVTLRPDPDNSIKVAQPGSSLIR